MTLEALKRRLVLGVVALSVCFVAGYLIFVLTSWGQLHDNAAYVSRFIMSVNVRRLGSGIASLVQVWSIALGGIALLVLARLRGRIAAGAVIGAAWASAVVLVELLKWVLPRPPLHSVPAKFALLQQSYPSGHVTVPTCAALAIVLLVPARWRQWAAVGAGFVSASYGCTVVFTGMHRPSDALGGIALSGALMSLAAIVLVRIWGRSVEVRSRDRLALIASAVVAIGLAAGWWHYARMWRVLPHGDNELLVLAAAAITAAAFAMTAWFGAMVKHFDWNR